MKVTLKTIGNKEVETSIEALKVELHLDLLVVSLSYMPLSLPPIKDILSPVDSRQERQNPELDKWDSLKLSDKDIVRNSLSLVIPSSQK